MAEKGGASPLVLFKGLAGNGQEVAHRELRLGVCGAAREGRRRVRWRTPGRSHPAQPLWKNRVSSVAPPPPPSPVGQSPHEDCVPMRGRAEASFPLTLFAPCELLRPRPYRYRQRRDTRAPEAAQNHGYVFKPSVPWSPYSQRLRPHASVRIACLEMGTISQGLDMKSSFEKGSCKCFLHHLHTDVWPKTGLFLSLPPSVAL